MSVPNAPSLSNLINKGSEGGLEFARIVNLLLFEDSQANGYYFQSFSDSAGDYKGVDSIQEKGFIKIGFQYKFFAGDPKGQKSDIKKSLFNAIDKFGDIDIWILVTPDNFTKHGLNFIAELENENQKRIIHWGHNELFNLLLKYPHIGKRYYPSSYFEAIESNVGRQPTSAEILNFFNQFISQKLDTKELFLSSQPRLSDLKKIFVAEIYKEVYEGYNLIFGDTFDNDDSLNIIDKDGPVRIKKASIEDIDNGTANLPGGMTKIHKEYGCFQRDVTFYTLEVGGMYFSVWCFIEGRWVFLPKPWWVVRPVYQLRNDKEVNRLIKRLKRFGVSKLLKDKNSSRTKMIINRIINELSKS